MGRFAREIGFFGERIAEKYLLDKGFKIIDLNYHCRYGEIDIIALSKDEVLVFVEVKNYHKNSLVHPLEAITKSKQNRLIATAKQYLARYHLDDVQARFDLIIVEEGRITDYLPNIILLNQ